MKQQILPIEEEHPTPAAHTCSVLCEVNICQCSSFDCGAHYGISAAGVWILSVRQMSEGYVCFADGMFGV